MSADTDSSSSSLGFKQLDDANYSIWLPRMTDALKKKRYWRYANGTEAKPELDNTIAYAADAAGKAAKAKALKEFHEELKEWEDSDDAAAALIRSGVSDSHLHHVASCTSAHETWTAIRTAHEKQGLNHALSYLNLLWSTRLPEGGKVQEHITALRTAHDRLVAADVGMDFSDQALAGILMMSFPSSYEPIKMTLSTLQKQDFTVSAVSRAMLNEEQRRLTSAALPPVVSGASEQSALTVQRPQQRQQAKAPGVVMLPCNWCGLDNHLDAQCHRKLSALPQRTPAERAEALRNFRNRRRGGGGGGDRGGKKEANFADLSDDGGNAYLAIASFDDAESDTAQQSPATVACVAASQNAVAHDVSLHAKGLGSRGDALATEWYVDSGASYHYCRHREWFDDFTPINGQSVSMGDGGRVPLLGRGTIRGHVPVSESRSEGCSFTNVHYAPELAVNLLSVAAMTAKGLKISFHGRVCTIRNAKGKIIGRAVQVTNRLYQISLSKKTLALITPAPKKPESAATRELIKLFHSRLGHPSHDSVRKLFANHMGKDTDTFLRGRVISTSSSSSDPPETCEACHLGKSHRTPLPQQSTTRSTAPLELVHMDVCGPFRVPSAGGSRYWLLIVDDYSRWAFLRTMKEKSEAPAVFKAFKAYAELHFKKSGHLIKQVRIDGGGEFGSNDFRQYLAEQGISVQETSAYTSQQNGVVERKHRVVAERMRAMMLAWGPSHNVPAALWAEAARTSVYLLNRCVTTAVPNMTPHEAWHGVKPSYSGLRTFACLAYAHSHPATRNRVGGLGKLGPQSTRCAFLGYSETAKAYRLWDLQTKKVITSAHVVFEERQPAFNLASAREAAASVVPLAAWEDILPPPLAPAKLIDDEPMPPLIPPPANMVAPAAEPAAAAPLAPVRPTFLQVLIRNRQEQMDRAADQPAPQRAAPVQLPRALSREEKRLQDTLRPGPKVHAPSTVANIVAPGTIATPVTTDDPSTYEDAMSRPDAQLWQEAMQAEINSLTTAGTYDVVALPIGWHAIGGKWVFRTKRGPDGKVIKYKARWVAQGFAQKYGIDYNETFAPVARFDSIRAILALVAQHDWELHQMDVRSAYLNGDLEEELYMKQPTGFVRPGTDGLVCRLNKSLYGLKQAGRTWNKRIDVELKARGFTPIHADPCVYAYKRGSVVLIISLYVDDLLLASDSLAELTKVKAELQTCFDMDDMGEASFALGIKITRDRAARTLTISQGAYLREVLSRFDMQDSRPVATPMEPKCKLAPATAATELDAASKTQYQSAVGALLHAARATRPDISFALTALSQHCKAPTEQHWQAVKRVLRYVRGTADRGLTYRGTGSPNEPPTLQGYCDSDYAEDETDRRSITGYAFLLSGAAVSWTSRKQPTVAHSSTEAEYMAASDAAKEAVWWRSFLSGLGYSTEDATSILSDSQGSIALSKNPEGHRKVKHIGVRHHFIRDEVAKGTLTLEYTSTSQMAADVLTKPVSTIQHDATTLLLGMNAVRP
jgi:transposase InsO family protein